MRSRTLATIFADRPVSQTLPVNLSTYTSGGMRRKHAFKLSRIRLDDDIRET